MGAHNLPISIFGSHGTFVHLCLAPMESDEICTNLYTEEIPKENHTRMMNQTKTPIHFPEAESICSAMFRNLMDSQNAVWHLALEGEILLNYENHSN